MIKLSKKEASQLSLVREGSLDALVEAHEEAQTELLDSLPDGAAHLITAVDLAGERVPKLDCRAQVDREAKDENGNPIVHIWALFEFDGRTYGCRGNMNIHELEMMHLCQNLFLRLLCDPTCHDRIHEQWGVDETEETLVH